MRPRQRTALALGLAMILAAAAASAGEELFAAARAGDLETVRRLVESGAEIDAVDKYGSTALLMAAGAGRLEVARYLVERGADLEHAETFYGATPIMSAFFNDHREVLLLLLEAGAEGRENALEGALVQDDLEMARAAVAGGPLHASRLEAARRRVAAGGFDETWKELLESAESRPDPEPPEYTLEELHAFTGLYEGWTSDLTIEVVLREGELHLALDGTRRGRLVVTGDRSFRTADDSLRVAFNGRAGTIEGVVPRGEGVTPQLLRRSVAEPIADAGRLAVAGADEPSGERTVHWPGFRGANATGIGDGDDAPVTWDPETGENIHWRAEIPGLGNSSPVVWGDRVFLTTAVASEGEQTIQTGLSGSGQGVDEAVEHSWRVLAFDKTTGAPLWDTEVGRGVPLTRRHFKATQANSTPATDGRHLVVVFPTAGLACLDLDGNLLWKHELGGLNAGAFADPGQEWGYASSPIIWRDRAIAQVDVHEGQYLAAWDLATGEELWRTEREVAPSWATPTVVDGPGGPELVVNGSTIHGYDPETGAELWSLGPNSELVIATPVAGDGVTYVSAGYPPIKPIYAIRNGVRGALEAEPGEEHESLAWSHDRGGAYMPTPLLYRGLLYVVHHNGRIVAYDAASGAALYKERFSDGGVFTGSPVAVNGRLYLPTEEGMVYVLAAGPEYRELALNRMGEPLMATPAVSEGALFLRTPSELVAVGEPAVGPASGAGAAAPAAWPQWRGPHRDGRVPEARVDPWPEEGPAIAWRRELGAGFSAVSVAGGRLYTAMKVGKEEHAVALDAGTGETIWSRRIDAAFLNERGDGPRSTPTLDGDRLFILSSHGKLTALALDDGRMLWRQDLARYFGAVEPNWGFAASPLVVDGMVVTPVGGEMMALAAFDRDDGKALWGAHVDKDVGYSSPIVAELGGRRQIVALTGQTLGGYSLDGELLWSLPWPVVNGINVATPLVVGDDRVFVSSSYDVGAAVLEIRPGEGPGEDAGLEVAEVWRERVMKNHFQDAVLHQGVLYGFDNAILKAIEADTGEELWKVRGFGKGQLILAGERLVVLGENGRLALLEASPEGFRELASTALDERRHWTPPVLAGGRLYVRSESELVAFDLGGAAGAAVASAAATGGAEPAPEAPAAGELTAGELVRRNLEARGDAAAWERIEALRVAGRFNLNGRESRFEAWRQGRDRVRFEIRFGSRLESFVHNDGRAWFRPMREPIGAVEGEALERLMLQAEAWIPWRDPWSAAERVEYLGTVDSGEGLRHRLRRLAGWPQEWRLADGDFLVVEADLGRDGRPLTLHQSDWREVEGIVMPHYAEVAFGTGLYSLTVEEVEIDPELPPGVFLRLRAGEPEARGSAADEEGEPSPQRPDGR